MRGDLSAALSAGAHRLLISAMQLSDESYDALSEVFITDDALTRPAVEVLGILLHEATHAVADRRGIKDTSRQGRYHNARFKALAEEIGLEGHDRDPLFGWSAPESQRRLRSTAKRSRSSSRRSRRIVRPASQRRPVGARQCSYAGADREAGAPAAG